MAPSTFHSARACLYRASVSGSVRRTIQLILSPLTMNDVTAVIDLSQLIKLASTTPSTHAFATIPSMWSTHNARALSDWKSAAVCAPNLSQSRVRFNHDRDADPPNRPSAVRGQRSEPLLARGKPSTTAAVGRTPLAAGGPQADNNQVK